MTTCRVLPSHRFPQHNLQGDVVLPSGRALPKLEWENNSCGLACIQSILDLERLPIPLLDDLLVEGLETGAYRDDKGWLFQGLLSLGRAHGLDGMVIPAAAINILEDLPNHDVAPIVSVSCGFPENPPVKGGHLVVFRGVQTAETDRMCFCDDPSTQGSSVFAVQRDRFWSSFSGRALIMKEAEAWRKLWETQMVVSEMPS